MGAEIVLEDTPGGGLTAVIRLRQAIVPVTARAPAGREA